jgi:hypothetical protein
VAHCIALEAWWRGFHPVHESGGVGCEVVCAVGENCVFGEVDYEAAEMVSQLVS